MLKRNKQTKYVMCLYGKYIHKKYVVGYCRLHGCYIDKRNIKERNCNRKKGKDESCNHFEKFSFRPQRKRKR